MWARVKPQWAVRAGFQGNIRRATQLCEKGALRCPLYPSPAPPSSSTASLFSSQPAIRASLPGWHQAAALAFCRGLLRTERTPTLTAIMTAAGPVMAPLGELFRDEFSWWDPGELWRAHWAGLEPGGSLLLDDTVIPKENTISTEATHPVFAGCEKRVVRGQTFMAAVYVQPSGGVRLLWMGLWLPDGPGKLVLARRIIEQLLEAGVRPADISFDAWYADAELLGWIAAQGLIWTTRIRKNRRFYFPDGVEGNPSKWAKGVPIESWHHYREHGAYAKAIEVANHDIKPAKLVAVRYGRSAKADDWVYMLTNDRTAGVRKVIGRYRRRWGIEVVFRTCKQVLGMNVYRHLTAIGAERHVALVGTLFNYLSGWQQRTGLTIGQLKRSVAKAARTGPHGFPMLQVAA